MRIKFRLAIITLITMGMVVLLLFACKKETGPRGLPLIQTTDVIIITSSTATCGGHIYSDSGSAITAKGVVWSTSNHPTIADHKTFDGTGTADFTSRIIILSPATRYYFRAYATNAKGTAYGVTKTFVTVPKELIDSRDGNSYKLIGIREQCWMAENLRYLPEVMGPATGSWTTPCYYVYGYEGTDIGQAMATANYQTYGVLYNWPAASTACPQGWHLPYDDEWKQLEMNLGMSQTDAELWGVRGTNQGSQMAGRADLWMDGMLENDAAFGSSPFNALPAGYRSYNDAFYSMGRYCMFWSRGFGGNEYYRDIYYNRSTIYRYINTTDLGFCVRCIKDE